MSNRLTLNYGLRVAFITPFHDSLGPMANFNNSKFDPAQAVQFYQHDMDWANRMILGDSLQVMASLAQREDLARKVQLIYLDPPYGIRRDAR